MPSPVFSAGVALWLVAAYNVPLFRRLLDAGGGSAGADFSFLLAVAVVLWAAFNLVMTLFNWPVVGKITAAALVLLGAVASHFMDRYGVLLDASMIQNVVETDAREASELLHLDALLSMLAFAVAPIALIVLWPVQWASVRREIAYRVAGVLASSALGVALIAAYYPHFASATRNHRELRLMVTPFNVIRATAKYVHRQRVDHIETAHGVGMDAHMRSDVAIHDKPVLFLLVVGETARADHFSLGGYSRETNPRLRQQNVLWFSQVRSCGTSTAVSLPCMFSDGRGDGRGAREGLLHLLARAGYEIIWRDNNSGCKGVCDANTIENVDMSGIPNLCIAGECFDEVLLHELQLRIDGLRRNTVIVLHQKGNHGPAYYKRYPAAFERFTPACHSSDLGRCDRSSIVNAYDNAILYTDHVLAEAIELLKANALRFHTAMLYVSDHGESLGEKNVYLHGMPLMFAPEAQTHIPMMLWLGRDFAETHQLGLSCIALRARESASHANLFHTVIGLTDVATRAYRRDRDLLAQCRNAVEPPP